MYPAGRRDVAGRFIVLPGGLRVRVLEAGPAHGEPVFFVHGWGCSVYVFRRNYAALANAGYRVMSADLKGHGLSDKPVDAEEYTLDAMGSHVLEIMDALDVHRAALVGHSMGGAIAAQVALQRPDRVSRLALLAPVGFGVVSLLHLIQLVTPRTVAPLLPYVAARWIVALGLRLVYGGVGTFDARDVDEYWAPTQFPEFVCAMRELLHAFQWDPGRREELSRIATPTLVMFGTRDRVVQPNALDKVVSALPQGCFELVRGGGHSIGEEAPGQVNAALIAHLHGRLNAA